MLVYISDGEWCVSVDVYNVRDVCRFFLLFLPLFLNQHRPNQSNDGLVVYFLYLYYTWNVRCSWLLLFLFRFLFLHFSGVRSPSMRNVPNFSPSPHLIRSDQHFWMFIEFFAFVWGLWADLRLKKKRNESKIVSANFDLVPKRLHFSNEIIEHLDVSFHLPDQGHLMRCKIGEINNVIKSSQHTQSMHQWMKSELVI